MKTGLMPTEIRVLVAKARAEDRLSVKDRDALCDAIEQLQRELDAALAYWKPLR